MIITNFGTTKIFNENTILQELLPMFVVFILFVFSLFDSKVITSLVQALIHFFKTFGFLELWSNISIIITGAFTHVVYSFLFPLELVFNLFGIHNFKIKELVFYNAYKDFYWAKCLTNIFILFAFVPFCAITDGYGNSLLGYIILGMIAFCVFSNFVMLILSLAGKIQVLETSVKHKINPLVLDIQNSVEARIFQDEVW